MSVQALLTIVSAALVLCLAGLWARARLTRRQDYRLHRDKFFVLAHDLIRSDDCPMELAVALRHFGATMNELAVLAILVRASIVGRWRSRPKPKPLVAALENSPRAVRTRFWDAYQHAVLAVSYRSVLFGPLIRRHYCRNHGSATPAPADKGVIGEVVRCGERHESPRYIEWVNGGLRLKAA
jgi:hypothetical protein